jgi:hypothetical protein
MRPARASQARGNREIGDFLAVARSRNELAD